MYIYFVVVLLYLFYNFIVPLGFLTWEIWVAFPGSKPAVTKSCYPTYDAYWVFQCFHNPLNSDMDYRIFNVDPDVKHVVTHRGLQTL